MLGNRGVSKQVQEVLKRLLWKIPQGTAIASRPGVYSDSVVVTVTY